MKTILLEKIKINPGNPRQITASDFTELKNSLQKDSEIMTVRPLVLNSKNDFTLLAGEQRYKALLELNYIEIPTNWILFADSLTDEQKKKFILLDNIHSGTWDISKLTETWSIEELTNLKLDIPGLDLNVPELLQLNDKSESKSRTPLATDNEYSVFELVMLHSNKVKLLDTLDKVKNENSFDKMEDALMYLVNSF